MKKYLIGACLMLTAFGSGYAFCDYHNAGVIVLLDGAVIENVEMRSVHIMAKPQLKSAIMSHVRMTLPKLLLPNEPYISLRCDMSNGYFGDISMVGNWDLYDDLLKLIGINVPAGNAFTDNCLKDCEASNQAASDDDD
jgi:hypothetical protein